MRRAAPRRMDRATPLYACRSDAVLRYGLGGWRHPDRHVRRRAASHPRPVRRYGRARGAGYAAAREELRRRTQGCPLVLVPHHRSYDRIVADVICRGVDVGRAMDAAGWSKPVGARR